MIVIGFSFRKDTLGQIQFSKKTMAVVFGKMIAVDFDFLKHDYSCIRLLERCLQIGLIFVKMLVVGYNWVGFLKCLPQLDLAFE